MSVGRVEHGRAGRGRRRAGGSLSAAVLALACTACGLGDDEDRLEPPTTEQPEQRQAPAPATGGGVLRVLARATALRLDGTSSSGAVWSLEHVTCNGLLDFP
jgi:hypothetical protein